MPFRIHGEDAVTRPAARFSKRVPGLQKTVADRFDYRQDGAKNGHRLE
jgi:hypothetical protein